MAEEQLELRVLTGIHAGARAAATREFLIGADPECEIVLCDPGIAARHARIEVDGNHWKVVPLFSEQGAPTEAGTAIEMASGERIAFGTVLISIEAANAPWHTPDPEEQATTLTLSPAVPAAPGTAADDAADAAAAAADLPAGSGAEALAPEGPGGLALRVWAWVRAHPGFTAALATCVIAPFALFIALSEGSGGPGSKPGTGAALPRPAIPAPRQDLAAVDVILQRSGNASLRAVLQKNGAVLVTGYVPTEEDYLAVATPLAAVKPRPLVQVHIEDELRQATARWNALAIHRTRRLEYLGAGRLRLQGEARDAGERDEIVQRVREEIPAAAHVDNQVRLWSEVGTNFSQRLTRLGFAGFTSAWRDNRLVLEFPALPADEMAKLESEAMRLNQETRGAFPFRIQARRSTINRTVTAGVARATLNPGDPSMLPFEIRSVMGGRVPYIVLEDQTMVMLGGEIAGYRLSSITASEIIFEGPNTIRINR